MSSRIFTHDDQLAFAALSGDFNPLHVDPVHARRLMYGAAAVHGVHTLLWSLDQWAAERGEPFVIVDLKVTFSKPVRVGQPINLIVRKDDGVKVRLLVQSGTETTARIDFSHAPASPNTHQPPAVRRFAAASPIEVTEYTACSGEMELAFDPDLGRELLPALTELTPPDQIAALLAATRLVGMECPGLHSVFSELDLTFQPERSTSSVAYAVTLVDPRFALMSMSLTSPAVSGEVRAFIRPAPQRQLTFADARTRVEPASFSGQRAMVIGGSRGLGEVAAKLLAAGGAEVRISYHQGKADALALVEEITAGGGAASCGRYDALAPEDDASALAEAVAWRPSHLYYFATPFIATGQRGQFSQPLFDRFSAYYVGGLAHAVTLFSDGLKAVFNPSTVFVEDTPDLLVEYAAAKAASEFLSARIAGERGAGFRMAWPRLPKVDTDQTASLGEGVEADPAPLLLNQLRDFNR